MRLIGHVSRFMVALALAVGVSGGCSSSSKGGTDAAGGSGDGGGSDGHDATGDGAATMALTSSALAEGGTFRAENTCAGVNTSPPLTWTAGPAGTMSYAVTLTDTNNDAPVHWVIWDIPAATTTLPAALPGDTTLTTPVSAKQLHRVAFFGAGGAYRGPCPSGNLHTYRFDVNAIGTATLAGVTGTLTTEQIRDLVQAASLAHGSLSGTSNATAPPADAGGN